MEGVSFGEPRGSANRRVLRTAASEVLPHTPQLDEV